MSERASELSVEWSLDEQEVAVGFFNEHMSIGFDESNSQEQQVRDEEKEVLMEVAIELEDAVEEFEASLRLCCEDCGHRDGDYDMEVKQVMEDACDVDTGQHYILDRVLCEGCYGEYVV